MTSARQIYLGSRRGPALPYDAEVEFLQSTGTQWIDTGYTPTRDSVFELRFSPNNVDFVAHAVHGNAYSTTTKYELSEQAPITIWTGNGYNNRFFYAPLTLSGATVGGIYEITQSAYGIVRDGVQIGSYDQSQMRIPPNEPMWLFNFMNGAAPAYGLLKLYHWKSSENGETKRDMIPVRFTNEQGQSEGAMYDRVSGQLFRNAGTGAFNYGNDK